MDVAIRAQGIRESCAILRDVDVRDRIMLMETYQQVVQALGIDLPSHFCQLRACWSDDFRLACLLSYKRSVIVVDTQKIEWAGNHLCIRGIHLRDDISQPGEHVGRV